MSAVPPSHHKTIAKHIAKSWGDTTRIILMSAEGTSVKQAIAVADGHPKRGVVAYSTVGLCDHGGYELASIGASRNKSFIKAVFDVASYVADGTRALKPGVVFEKALSRYYSRCEAGHLFVTSVSIAGVALEGITPDTGRVRWLYLWPLVSDEFVTLESEGYRSFERRLRDAGQIDLIDLDRGPILGVPKFDPWGLK